MPHPVRPPCPSLRATGDRIKEEEIFPPPFDLLHSYKLWRNSRPVVAAGSGSVDAGAGGFRLGASLCGGHHQKSRIFRATSYELLCVKITAVTVG
jgi:hypothetical protein